MSRSEERIIEQAEVDGHRHVLLALVKFLTDKQLDAFRTEYIGIPYDPSRIEE